MIAKLLSRRGILTVAVLMLFAASASAFLVVRSKDRPPDPTLPQAYAKAIEALGELTNSFYCLSASALAISDSSGPTEWHLMFYATNGQWREVVVPTSGKIIVRDRLRESPPRPDRSLSLESFGTFDSGTTVADVIARVGQPEMDVNTTGMHNYYFRLADGSVVLISSSGLESRLNSVRHGDTVLYSYGH